MPANDLMVTVMWELKPDMTIEDLFLTAKSLCERGLLNVVAEGPHVTYFVGDVFDGRVLDMEAAPDFHTGRGFTPPWGILHIYDRDGSYKEAVKIPEARTKIWG